MAFMEMNFKSQEGKKVGQNAFKLQDVCFAVLENYTERERDNSYSYPWLELLERFTYLCMLPS